VSDGVLLREVTSPVKKFSGILEFLGGFCKLFLVAHKQRNISNKQMTSSVDPALHERALEQKFASCMDLTDAECSSEDESDWEDMVSDLALDDTTTATAATTPAAATLTTSSVLCVVAAATMKAAAEFAMIPHASTGYLTREAKLGCVAAQLELASSCKKAGDHEGAVAWYSQAVKQGSPAGHFELGLCLRAGAGVARDDAKSLQLIKRAAMAKYAPAQHEMGLLHHKGTNRVGRSTLMAAVFWKMAAAQGFARSQHNLGLCYDDGTNGFEKDEAKAAEFYTLAANQGLPDAIFNLAVCYMNGQGVGRDHKKAAALCQKLVDLNGDPEAMLELAYCYEHGLGVARDEGKAFALCKKAAAHETCDRARFRLGRYYMQGVGVVRNLETAIAILTSCKEGPIAAKYIAIARTEQAEELMKQFNADTSSSKYQLAARAVELYHLATMDGNAQAQLRLGVLHMHGLSSHGRMVVERDLEMAVKLFSVCKDKNAAKCLAMAQTEQADDLMKIYEHSSAYHVGAKAAELYRLAANAGDRIACVQLGNMYVQGVLCVGGPARDWKKAAELFAVAEKQDDPAAAANLGVLYARGLGVGTDAKKAAALFAKGHRAGSLVARHHLAVCYEHGLGVERDAAKAAELRRPELVKDAIHVFL
jgi:TPR repeat protein